MRTLPQLDPDGCFQRRRKRLCRRKYRSKVYNYTNNIIMIHNNYAYGCHSAYPIQGPNYTWHCDGYNKLKPYGFPIHGCIDGLVPKYNNYNQECMSHRRWQGASNYVERH